jgi:sulfatase modifying factor 1
LDFNGSDVTEKKLKDYAVYDAMKTMPVKQRKPNFYGLYDMHGNVWEWCQDYYDETNKNRVLRGGSWYDLAEYMRVSCRLYFHPDCKSDLIGFRVVACLARTP